MKGKEQMWQAELAELSGNADFLGVFLDDLTFHIWDAETVNVPAPKPRLEAPAIEAQAEAQEQLAPFSMQESAPASPESPNEVEHAPSKVTALSHTGKVVVLIPKPLLPESQMLLQKILDAAGVKMDEVILLQERYAAKALTKFADARIVLSFGAVIDFAPDHQLRSKTITIIMAKDLLELQTDTNSKKQLWESMRRFFQ
jgi:DNA polymerase III psi subunit